MNILAFDTGTEWMSMAVSRAVDGQVRQWQHSAPGGALASTGLIAGILDLLQQADLRLDTLDAICFGAGPGSFTGLRTACSVAQGLAFGAGVPVLPVDSLLAVAEEARFAAVSLPRRGVVTALLDARMNELYADTYAFEGSQWTQWAGSCLVRPSGLGEYLQRVREESSARFSTLADAALPWTLAGNAFAVYGDQWVLGRAWEFAAQTVAVPTATALLRLAPQWLAAGRSVDASQALPHYIRDKVAQTTLERMAEKAAAPVPVSTQGV